MDDCTMNYYIAIFAQSFVGEWRVFFPDFPACEARGFTVEDATFAEAGMVGLWTKADSVTLFSGFTYGERR